MSVVEITLGKLHLVGEETGDRVHVTVLGAGAPGHRPLRGTVVVSPDEFDELVAVSHAWLTESVHRRRYQDLAQRVADLEAKWDLWKPLDDDAEEG